MTSERAGRDLGAALTRAEAHALRRSQPLTPGQFSAFRERDERGGSPLRHI